MAYPPININNVYWLIEALGQTLSDQLNRIERKVDKLMTESNATQADIDALSAQVTSDDAAIQSAVAALQAEIASLQGQGVDVTGLRAAVDQLTTDANADQPTTP